MTVIICYYAKDCEDAKTVIVTDIIHKEAPITEALMRTKIPQPSIISITLA